jgi:5-methylcytosine-specific restriction endonuclease McrA
MEQEFKYVKKCLNCKREYGSNARGQRFCCKECQQNYAKKQKEERRFYSSHKELSRIKARSHSLAVEIARYQCYQQGKEFVCEVCSAPATEVHHANQNFLDNTPSNLQILCKKCHSAEHSRLTKEEIKYDPSFYEFAQELYKK